jgi:drug/metabolite transporter (DMT)-like permease
VLGRSLVGMTLVLALLARTRGWRAALGGVRTGRPLRHALRATSVLVSNITYFVGLAAMPLADGVALFFVAPLVLTALSVPLLGERVGWRRWSAVAVAFLGVLLMVRPGGQAGAGGLWPEVLVLLSALAYALTQIQTRLMGGTESALAMSFWTQVAFILVALGMAAGVGDGRLADGSNPSLDFLFRAWAWPAPADLPWFLATGLAVSVGGLMLAQAYRTVEAALVAPFEYSAMPMAVVWGVVVFGTWPDAAAWAGIALICGSGLYALAREARASRTEEGP